MFPILFKLVCMRVDGQGKLFVLCGNPGPGLLGHIPLQSGRESEYGSQDDGGNNKMCRAGPLYLIKITSASSRLAFPFLI